ncbi:MAG: adenylate kinase [Actinobacteria bacterium]|nr:adenylate kinase [Actinomycetota bacterium]
MNRVSVIGCTGSGKTTVARLIADLLQVPHLELDSVYHQPDWTPLADDLFRDRVRDFTLQTRWVVDGNYTSQGVADVVWPRADTIVWLDLPRSTVMDRVIRRTIRRAASREVLWNGNREPWSNFFDPRSEKNIVAWTWTRHGPVRRKYEAKSTDGTWEHASVHRLQSDSDVNDLIAALDRAHRS